MLQKKIFGSIFFRSKFFHRLGFFSNKLSHTQNLQNFHYGFFPEKKSCNRSRIFTRNGWWYSQVPNRPREKDIDDFRFLSPVPTHGSQPMGMGPNPWSPTHGPQPGGPSPWVPTLGPQPGTPWLSQPGLNADNSRAPTRGGVYPPRSDG